MKSPVLPLLVGSLALAGCFEEHNPGAAAGTVVPDCRIEADGLLSVEEVPARPGLMARYVRNTPGEPVESLPTEVDGVVDFETGPDEVGLLVALGDPTEAVLALFPEAGWTAPLTVESPDLLGVYRRTDSGVELLGGLTGEGVEPAASVRFRYEPPLSVLPLPLGVGDRWGGQVSFRDAVFGGLPNAGVEDWAFEAVSLGAAKLPGGVEVDEVLRVEVRVSRTLAVASGGNRTESTQTLWLAPCFGEVGRVVDGGAELRRLVLD